MILKLPVTTDASTFASRVLDHIDTTPGSVTPRDLERFARDTFCITRTDARTRIREMVARGALSYRWDLGHAFIERSFHRPVRISPHIVLRPAALGASLDPGTVAVTLEKGAAFGTGRHPTTRLCLQGIDALLTDCRPFAHPAEATVLDIGTGSGVLVLAAVLLGMGRGLGIDRDLCAIQEAYHNVQVNALMHRVHIVSSPLDAIEDRFDLILANLRTPTLSRLVPHMIRRLKNPGAVVLSGMRVNEVTQVVSDYGRQGFTLRWRAEEKGWGAVVLAV